MTDRILKNRLEAVEYLNRRGYKIRKSKLYKDAKAGKITLQADGSIYSSDLEHYARAEGLNQLDMNGPRSEEIGKLSEEKLKAEIQKLDWENKKREFEYERELGRWIPREDLELELASRAGVFDSGLRTKIKTFARDWVYLVGGTPDKVPEFVQAVFEALDEQMNEFARLDRFEVIFEDSEE